MMGLDFTEKEKYYALLQGDKLKLFDTQANAYSIFDMKIEATGLKQVHTIYRSYSENLDIG